MAKRFTFRLETLLSLRTQKVDDAKKALGEAIQNRIKAEEQCQEIKTYLDSLLTQKQQGLGIQAGALEAHWQHRVATEAEIKHAEQVIVQLLEIEELRRKELAEAMQNQKILEKLKEKKLEEYKVTVAHEEQIFLDDIAGRKGLNSNR